MRLACRGRTLHTLLTMGLLAGGPHPAQGQAPAPCTAAPLAPRGLSLMLRPAEPGARETSRPEAPAVLTIAWTAPAQAPDSSTRAATSYLIEAGTTTHASDVARLQTEGTVTRYVTPVPNGTFYVRVRARNDCGLGPESAERSVRVRGSVEMGQPNPAVLLDTVQGLRERLGSTAFVQVTGQVRNGWGAAPASFVDVTATFDGPRGDLVRTAGGFVNGSSRRLGGSRLVTDTVLDVNATGCFALFAEVAPTEGQVNGLRLRVASEAFVTDALDGLVLSEAGPPRADDFGDLLVAGQVRNAGQRATVLNEVWTELTDQDGRVVGCSSTPVRAAVSMLDGVQATRTGLAPGGVAPIEVMTEVELARARGLVQWVTWDEESSTPGPASLDTTRHRELRQYLVTLLDSDDRPSREQVARARDSLRREVRAIELALRPRVP